MGLSEVPVCSLDFGKFVSDFSDPRRSLASGTLRREALSQSIQIHPQPIGFLATIHPCPYQSIQILKLMSALSRLMLLSDSCGY